MTKFDTLYHLDENDNVRVWWMEQEGDKYRTVSGIENGNLVTSEWKLAEGKNLGKRNETSGEEQALAEIKSQYTKKIDRKYFTSREDIYGEAKIIEPMLAAKFAGWDKKWSEVFSQPKLDGMRCIATKDGLFSRQGKPIISVPHINDALRPIFAADPSMIFDGELYNHELHDNFNELLSLARQSKPTVEDYDRAAKMIQYHIYDTVVLNMTFESRCLVLTDALLYAPECIHRVRTTRIKSIEELDLEYTDLLAKGYEGQMVRLNGQYEQRRSKNLLKRKEFIDEEFPVLEILEGQGNWSGYAKSVTCKTKDGVIFNAGIKGTQDFAKELLHRRPAPKTVTVRYQNKTPDGSLRFPIAVAFYENERDV